MKRNILIIDDDHICNFLTLKILKKIAGINEVYTALNGSLALNMLQPKNNGTPIRPDIILLDLNMPIMDGFGFLEAFRNADIPGKENILIIIVTSPQNPEDLKRILDSGITHYLIKPLVADELKKILKTINVV